MKVNLSIEISDEQRNVLACMLAGKPLKALAKREDVRDFVEGCIAGLTKGLIPTAPEKKPTESDIGEYDVGDGRLVRVKKGPKVAEEYNAAFWALLTDEELKTAEALRAEGKCDSYIRGYFYVERAERRKGAPLKGADDRKKAGRSRVAADDAGDPEEE